MRWKTRRKRNAYWRLWIVQRPQSHETVLTSRNLSKRSFGNSTGLTMRKGVAIDECQVWETGCKTATWRKIRCFLKKTAAFVARLSGAGVVMYLYSVKAIESAFQHRGYVAYGGEYLMIPFVFYGVFKVLGIAGEVCYWMAGKQKTNKKVAEKG